MVFSRRDKYIGIGIAAVVVMLGIYGLIISPYFDQSDDLASQLTKAKETLAENQDLFRAQKFREPAWKAMLANGLQADDSTAQSRTQQLLQTWASSAGIQLDSLSSERAPSQKGPFEAVNFSLEFNSSGPDSMRQIAKYLWSVESATVPLRLSDMRIQSTKEGSDQVNVKLVVSALYMPIAAQNSGTGGAGGDVIDALEGMQ